MYSNKLRRVLAVGALAFFLGATAAQAQVQVPPTPVIVDSDGDGYADDVDDCDNSSTILVSPTVVINGVDTGIQNTEPNAAGCTVADLLVGALEECLDETKNHGQFVRCVSHETNKLKRARAISGKLKGKFQSFIAKMKLVP
jgi:hypothetical protein